MNKIDFVSELARMTNMPKAKALGVTNAMVDILVKKLNEKEKIQFIKTFGFPVAGFVMC